MSETDNGVWVVWQSAGRHIDSIHATEIEALRRANQDGYLTASYVEYGANIVEALS